MIRFTMNFQFDIKKNEEEEKNQSEDKLSQTFLLQFSIQSERVVLEGNRIMQFKTCVLVI